MESVASDLTSAKECNLRRKPDQCLKRKSKSTYLTKTEVRSLKYLNRNMRILLILRKIKEFYCG